jgi:hypothetical protein
VSRCDHQHEAGEGRDKRAQGLLARRFPPSNHDEVSMTFVSVFLTSDSASFA